MQTLNKSDEQICSKMRINWLNFYVLPPVCVLGLLIELVSAITFYQINSPRQHHHQHHHHHHRSSNANISAKQQQQQQKQQLAVFRSVPSTVRGKKRQPVKIYQYLFLYSMSEMIILCVNIVFAVFNCGSYCGVHAYVSEYFIKQYERFAKIFLCNTLYTFNVLVEFKIACDRYEKLTELKNMISVVKKRTPPPPPPQPPDLLLSNGHGSVANNKTKSYKTHLRRCNYILGGESVNSVGLMLMGVSLLINTPYLIIYKIDTDSNMLRPDLHAINSFMSPLWLKLVAVAYFLKDFVCLVFVCAFNVMVFLVLRTARLDRNHNNNNNKSRSVSMANNYSTTSNESTTELGTRVAVVSTSIGRPAYERKEKRVAQMVLILSALFLIGHLPETFYRIKRKLNILFFTQTNYLGYYLIISNIVSFVASYVNICIYLYFSRTFFEQFKMTFLRFPRCQQRRQRNQV